MSRWPLTRTVPFVIGVLLLLITPVLIHFYFSLDGSARVIDDIPIFWPKATDTLGKYRIDTEGLAENVPMEEFRSRVDNPTVTIKEGGGFVSGGALRINYYSEVPPGIKSSVVVARYNLRREVADYRIDEEAQTISVRLQHNKTVDIITIEVGIVVSLVGLAFMGVSIFILAPYPKRTG